MLGNLYIYIFVRVGVAWGGHVEIVWFKGVVAIMSYVKGQGQVFFCVPMMLVDTRKLSSQILSLI